MRYVAWLAAAAAPGMATAARAEDPQSWSTLQVNVAAPHGWKASADLSGRTRANERAPQVLGRIQIGRDVSRHVTLWLGYVHAETLDTDRRNGLEQRATGQLDWDAARIGPFRVATRTRLEARVFRGADQTSWRLREQVRLLLPVGDRARLFVDAEPFVALNRTDNARRTFEQLRLRTGALFTLTPGMQLDVSYSHQILYRPDQQLVNHVFPVTMRVSI